MQNHPLSLIRQSYLANGCTGDQLTSPTIADPVALPATSFGGAIGSPYKTPTTSSYLPTEIPPYALVAFQAPDAAVLANARLTIYARSLPSRPSPSKRSNDPIPKTSRSATLAKLLSPGQWNRIRHSIYYKAHYRCQSCGRRGRLHCHEVWQYNQQTGYQHLRGFQALCQDCHQAKHIFFVRSPRRKANLLRHLALVNKLTPAEAQEQLAVAQRRQIALNQSYWIVNYGPYNWAVPAAKTLWQRRAFARFNGQQRRYCGAIPGHAST